MSEYQNTGESCAFLQCWPCRRYSYVGISQDITSSSSHLFFYIVFLKNSAKFTGTHLSLFSTCNLQSHWETDAGIYSFLWVLWKFFRNTLIMENLLRNVFERRTVRKMANRHSYYDKNISWSRQLFQKTDMARQIAYLTTIDRKLTMTLTVIVNSFTDISFLKYVTKIFCISYWFQESFLEYFRVHLTVAVSVYILSSKEANQLQVLYIRTLGKI